MNSVLLKHNQGMLLALVIVAIWALCRAIQDQGWSDDGVEPFLESPICNIDRVPREAIEEYLFEAIYLEKKPVIIMARNNAAFEAMTSKDRLLEDYGDVEIVLSSANTISREKIPMLFRDYVESMAPQPVHQLGNETFYLFGPENEISREFARLVSNYKPPVFAGSDLAFSFGIGPSGSGVPFHFHGHGFSEVLHGRKIYLERIFLAVLKRWLLYPPDHMPNFHPNRSSASWLRYNYPSLQDEDRFKLHDCIIERGEVLYFPGLWWHATVNIGETVFVSSFDSPRPEESTATLTKMLERMWKGSVLRSSSTGKEL